MINPHILLGIQVLTGLGLLFSGLYGYGSTLQRSRTLTPDEGIKRVLLFCIVMLAGGYLIGASVYTQGSPRCAYYDDAQKQRENTETCF